MSPSVFALACARSLRPLRSWGCPWTNSPTAPMRCGSTRTRPAPWPEPTSSRRTAPNGPGQTAAVVGDRGRRRGERPARLLLVEHPRDGDGAGHAPTRRLVVGHPFNPPHLVPLVEVVPSPGTDPEVVEAAVAFYRAMGKQPQVLSREIRVRRQPAAGRPVPRGGPPRRPRGGHRAGAGCRLLLKL